MLRATLRRAERPFQHGFYLGAVAVIGCPPLAVNFLDSVLGDAEKKRSARETLRDQIAASLECHAAIKVNMPLTLEKMRWLIDRLLKTSSPTTCPHGRPVILRLATRDILKGFHRI